MLTSFNPRGSVLAVGALTERVRASQSIQRPRQLDLPRCLRRGGCRGRQSGALIQALAGNTGNDVATAKQIIDPMLGYPGSPDVLYLADSGDLINVALMVERAAPQSQLDALLGGDWADRASYIASQGEGVWSTFGADPAVYANTQQAILAALDNPPVNPMTRAAEQGYSASADNRTIWLTLTTDQFNTLFNSVLLANSEAYAWTGPLSLPSTIAARHHRRTLGRPGRAFNNPVHAASVRPTTSWRSARCRSATGRPSTEWSPTAPTGGHRQRDARRDRRLLRFPAADRPLGARRSRWWKPACSSPTCWRR